MRALFRLKLQSSKELTSRELFRPPGTATVFVRFGPDD